MPNDIQLSNAYIKILKENETTPEGGTVRPGEYVYNEETNTIYTGAIPQEDE